MPIHLKLKDINHLKNNFIDLMKGSNKTFKGYKSGSFCFTCHMVTFMSEKRDGPPDCSRAQSVPQQLCTALNHLITVSSKWAAASLVYSSFWDKRHYTPAGCCYVTRIYEIRL